ncbi:natterin-4-like [Amblyomma americanum]
MANYGLSQYRPPCHWVLCHGESIPPNAVPGGEDKGGRAMFVARAVHEGDVIPGKVVPSRGFCYVPYKKEEHCYKDYQVLVSDGASLAWLPSSGGDVPSGAIQGGVTSSGEPLYIGRARHEGNLTVGKFHPSHKTVYVPFGGVEYGYSQYEILVCETINF